MRPVTTLPQWQVKSRLLRLSNARASSTGALPSADEGAGGRPTLKRRQPTPDATTDSGEQKPVEKQEPPKLKRTDTTPPPPQP